jgi:predicted RNA methylase
VRERKGSFFTPQIWVELSQKYLTTVLGPNWQDEYYIWDCAAGTGNLLHGLTNKYNIWASTLDKQDIEVMRDRVKNGANLLDEHVFQFDFLNDDFSSLPKPLREIIDDDDKRKKLIVYINPPYAEATSSKTISSSSSQHKVSVATSKTKEKYESELNQASKELFVQFIFRVYKEIKGSYIAHFSKVKILQGNHYKEFRQLFLPRLESMFIVPSDTFDNVKEGLHKLQRDELGTDVMA